MMKMPLSLIRSFVKLDQSPEEIAHLLTLLGIEVDQIINAHPSFAKVVVGKVINVQKHPDAKKLQIAEVSDGEKTYTVICGAPNCRAALKTAFAREGAVLTDRDGLQRKIERTKIRGVESFGMLCSAAELGDSDEHDQILELPQDLKEGTDLAKLLWDPIFELSLTPNLGHCMSALGIARELSAALELPLEQPEMHAMGEPLDREVMIHDFKLCPRYMCCVIEGVQIKPSPFWLQRQLKACGLKPINHVVDAANYIMLKTGQPLHAFDANSLQGNRIEIGALSSPAIFLGLDEVSRELPENALVISDGSQPIALAGIIGGKNSAVTEKTSTIFLEAAYFDPISIRNTSKKLALRTESSQRFEKGIDPLGLENALFEAAELMGGKITQIADVKEKEIEPTIIPYRTEKINQILGTKLSETEVEEIFKRLHFEVKPHKVIVPTYRRDLRQEIDLVEEVARIYGYHNIDKPAPSCSISDIPHDPIFIFENELKQKLVQLGLTELICCDLMSPKLAALSRLITPESMQELTAKYSKSEEYSILRTSLLPNLLQVIQTNLAQQTKNLAGFEIGRIHFLQNQQIEEIPMLGIVLTGQNAPSHWSSKGRGFDFFDLKGMIENLLNAKFLPSHQFSLHPHRQANIQVGAMKVGSLGEVHPRLLNPFDIDQRVFYAELNILHLLKMKKTHLKITPLAQYPFSERDWTITLAPKLHIDEIFDAIQTYASPILEKVTLTDLYIPEGLNQKNATFRFRYRDPFKTICLEEVEKEHSKMTRAITKLLAK